MGAYENGKLRYIGHAGGGFDKESLAFIRSKLDPLVIEESPFSRPPKTNMPVRWVRPELVCEVTFAEWTNGGLMRHPIFVGLREDKDPQQVKRETHGIFKSHSQSEESKIEKNKNLQDKTKKRADKNQKEILINKVNLTLTNLNKSYWKDEKITKGDLIEYYQSISSFIMPYLKNRPCNLLRHPNGIHGGSFFQKDMGSQAPEWLKTVEIYSESTDKMVNYLVCTTPASLLYMVNLGCIEINPWFSRYDKLEYPDYLVLDLDPESIGFDKVVQTALVIKELLDRAEAKSFCKTSGSTGLHIYVPLSQKYTFDIAKEFAHLVARIVHNKIPEITSLERSPSERKNRVYIDYLQNSIAQTLAAPYCARPRKGALVSTPLLWEEVNESLDPSQFTIKTIHKRLERTGDLFKGVLTEGINIIKCINILETLNV